MSIDFPCVSPINRLLDQCRHTLDAWQRRAEQRRLLMRLDERMLKDIAVSRADAEHEAAKPFWRA